MGADFYGTKRLKSPEEYILGAELDNVTNVYTLGALIFHFFGSYTNADIGLMYKNNGFFPCGFESWELSKTLYSVTLKAVNRDRGKRHVSVKDFFTAWNIALKEHAQYESSSETAPEQSVHNA